MGSVMSENRMLTNFDVGRSTQVRLKIAQKYKHQKRVYSTKIEIDVHCYTVIQGKLQELDLISVYS